MMNVEVFERIENYLNGNMSSSEAVFFEQQIEADPQLKKEFELQKITNEAILEGRMLDVRSKLASVHARSIATSGSLSAVKKTVIATLSLIAVSIGGYLLLSDEQNHDVIVENEIPAVIEESKPIVEDVVTKEPQLKNENNHEIVGEHKAEEIEELSETASKKVSKKVNATKAQPKRVVVDVCESVQIGTEVEVIPTCEGAKRGGVLVNSTQTYGGKAPYSYSINGNQFDSLGRFTRLGQGTYSFYIKDANGCVVKKADWIRIKTTSCK